MGEESGNAMTKVKSTLLVVDDVAENLDLLVYALGSAYTVRVATDGRSALRSAEDVAPDLIVLDIMMPEMDGYEVCRLLKKNKNLREIPVIFVTGLHEATEKVKGFSVGGVDYLAKPFDISEIRARVATHLKLSHQRRELQNAYERIRDIEKLRADLTHMIVHDMRQPLSIILGNLEMAQMSALHKKTVHHIDSAISSTETLLKMVAIFLDVSKMEEGSIPLVLSSVDMWAMMSDILRELEPVQEGRNIILNPHSNVLEIMADADLIQRVVQNLIGNAIKFTDKENGIIAVDIEDMPNNKVRLSIKDNGIGVPLEYQGKIFDKFYQAAARKQGNGHSSGLGLTFCKLAVEAHDGTIGLNSDMGEGSTFWFELPKR